MWGYCYHYVKAIHIEVGHLHRSIIPSSTNSPHSPISIECRFQLVAPNLFNNSEPISVQSLPLGIEKVSVSQQES